MAFYIEMGTGRQVDSSNLSSINPNSTYIESGTGKSLLGSALTPKPQVSATQALSYVFGAPKPVTTLSSTEGQKIVNTNANKLSSLETALSGATLGTAPAVNIKPGMPGLKMEGEQPAITGPLKSTSSSPAQQTMVKDINQAVSTGGLSVEQAQALKDLMSAQDEITSAAANAKMAQESGDYKAMNDYVKLIEERQKAYQDNLTAYYASVKDLRAQLANSLSPTAREYELNRKINDVRAQAEAFKTQTEEDKFREYEGQTLGFAGGRASEIDIRAEFKMQRMAQEEKALLADLGLEQGMRKSQKEGIEAQLGYLSDDFELQNKANDKINELEDKIIERADSLQKDAKETLIKILDSLKNIDVKTLDQGTLMKLEQMAVDAGIPFDLVVASLDAQHKRQVYEDSVKERTLSTARAGTLEERNAGAVAQFQSKMIPGATLAGGEPIFYDASNAPTSEGVFGFGANDGSDYIGKITPEAWKFFISAAPAYGLSREKFIEAFGYLLPNKAEAKQYDLTQKELSLIAE